jgi:hypothetical protein
MGYDVHPWQKASYAHICRKQYEREWKFGCEMELEA